MQKTLYEFQHGRKLKDGRRKKHAVSELQLSLFA